MPTYVYNCKACDYDKDVKHSMNEKPKISCEDCQGKMHKVIRSSNFQLKGSGWFGKSTSDSTY